MFFLSVIISVWRPVMFTGLAKYALVYSLFVNASVNASISANISAITTSHPTALPIAHESNDERFFDEAENEQIPSTVSPVELTFPYLRGSETLIRHAFDPNSNTLYVLDHGRDFLFRVGFDGVVDTLSSGIFADHSSRYLMDVNPAGDHLYFWEEELGDVYKFNLSTQELSKIDETTVEKLMRGHTAVFCPDNLIYVFSGYGVWEEKDFLLYFDETLKGWLKIDHEGPRPPRSENAFMVFEHGIDRFHVLLPNTQERREFTYYQFDRYEPEWRNIATVKLPSSAILPEHTVVASHSYRFDQKRGLYHLMGEYFFRISDAVIYRMQGAVPDDLLQAVYYFSLDESEWIRVGIIERDQFLRLHLSRISQDHLLLEPVTRRANYPVEVFVIVGMALLILTGGWITVKYLRKRPPSHNHKRIQLVRKSNGFQMFVDGEILQQPDPKLAIIWELIYRTLKENQTSIPLTDVNKALFGEERLDAHVSRVRSKLIHLVQEQVGEEVIWIERNKLDKRFKVMRVNPELIELEL